MLGTTKLIEKIEMWRPARFITGSIRRKLLLTILVVSLIPLIAMGVMAYQIFSGTLMDEAGENLEAIRKVKSAAI